MEFQRVRVHTVGKAWHASRSRQLDGRILCVHRKQKEKKRREKETDI